LLHVAACAITVKSEISNVRSEIVRFQIPLTNNPDMMLHMLSTGKSSKNRTVASPFHLNNSKYSPSGTRSKYL
jgi:hypothetical protein